MLHCGLSLFLYLFVYTCLSSKSVCFACSRFSSPEPPAQGELLSPAIVCCLQFALYGIFYRTTWPRAVILKSR